MRRNSNGISARVLVMAVALTLIIGGIIGGSVAWLTATSATVTNTFTYGNINITLTETTGRNYKIIPGVDISKDPKVTVEANSEACWLFVKVEQNGTFVANKVTYSIADGWIKGNGTDIPDDVYYREVGAVTADTSFDVLKGNEVIVSENLTKEDIKTITTNPTLTFTAYAFQKDSNFTTAASAWAKIAPSSTTNP